MLWLMFFEEKVLVIIKGSATKMFDPFYFCMNIIGDSTHRFSAYFI